ncbi:acyl-CoA desaturase [bacterium SCSIO 12741]|nr:acyl-CoA desaturase [bacterium SCSIO 12741]
MIIIAFFLGSWYLSLFTQSFFHHRYAAHAQFRMSKFTERFFYFLTWLFQGPNYLSPYGYGIMHRLHHKYADTEKDPHSPKYDKNLFAMMWRTKKTYSGYANYETEVDSSLTANVPQWIWFDKMARSWPSRLAWSAFYIWVYWTFVPEGMWYLWALLPINLLMSPVHGAIINWYAHIYGYRNFDVNDTSMNLLPFDFLMWGESYHNNHHKHGGSANFGGFRWHELDPMYILIRLFHAVGIIKLKKVEPFFKYKNKDKATLTVDKSETKTEKVKQTKKVA